MLTIVFLRVMCGLCVSFFFLYLHAWIFVHLFSFFSFQTEPWNISESKKKWKKSYVSIKPIGMKKYEQNEKRAEEEEKIDCIFFYLGARTRIVYIRLYGNIVVDVVICSYCCRLSSFLFLFFIYCAAFVFMTAVNKLCMEHKCSEHLTTVPLNTKKQREKQQQKSDIITFSSTIYFIRLRSFLFSLFRLFAFWRPFF